jgi:hypothetical protein
MQCPERANVKEEREGKLKACASYSSSMTLECPQ